MTTFCSVKSCQLEERLDHILAKLSAFEGAFPKDSDGNPDVVGHRRAHEAAIAADKAKEKFYGDLRLDLAKKGVWGIFIVLIGLILAGLAARLGIGSQLLR